ncbi:hypothetical protein [Oceanisphaera sp. W20_SRM_FM3]|uniref:hypothetical protein n=1 Tax=Oceanisphaera sp. W20_SRM_FM3 TaxID=3240267 RepID=UPI003F96006D
MKPQAGFTTLAISLLLLAILSAWSLFMVKTMVSERRLTLNEIEYRLTHAAAEQGLAEAIAMLKVDPDIQNLANSVAHDLGEVNYQVRIVPNATLPGIRQLQATASMADGARSQIRLALAERSVLNPQHAGPKYPLLLASTNTTINGQLRIVAHQDNANSFSIWSAGELNVTGALHSCYLVNYDAVTQDCSVSLSQVDALDERLELDMQLQDADFPADVLRYVFGYGAHQDRHLKAMATAVVTDCSAIKRAGFYIVSGGASCQLDKIVSSRVAPVILLVKDMAVVANMPTQFYGLLVLYGTGGQPLHFANGSELFGGLILGPHSTELNGDVTLHFDAEVLCTLSACQPTSTASPFRLLSVVAGSWHDD